MLTDKRFIIVTGVICILPVIAGIFLWSRLPESMATSFTWDGVPTAYHPKWFAVFVIPLMITAVHGLCAFSVLKREDYGNFRALGYGWAILICPVISIFAGVSLHAYGLGYDISLTFISVSVVVAITLIYGIRMFLKNRK